MAVSYAGVPLLLEDPGHEFQEWLERALSLVDARLFGGLPVALVEGRTDSLTSNFYKVGLPTPNWPAPPRPKINTLWIPTGASRWAVGLFLCSTDQLTEIRENLSSEGFAELKLEDERWPQKDNSALLTASMYLLPPRPVNHTEAVADGSELWLLPLVDRRYFFQFRDAGYLVLDETQWSSLIALLAARLGVSVSFSSIPSSYFIPDNTELSRPYENAAVLMDAVAACVGQRITFNLDTQSLILIDASDSTVLAGNNVDEHEPFRLAGGGHTGTQRLGMVPGSVRVVFPKYREGVQQEDGDVWVANIAPPVLTTMPNGSIKTFFDTAAADFTNNQSSQPNNAAQLVVLARQISAHYYAFQFHLYDVSYAGLTATWIMSGYDDYVWYHVGYQYPRQPSSDESEGNFFEGDYSCFTRIASLPYNFGVSEMLHQFPAEDFSSSSSTSSSSTSSSSSSTSSSSTSSSSTSSSSSSPSSSSSSSSPSSSSSSATSSSSSSPGDDVIVYIPTVFRIDDELCLPKGRIYIDKTDPNNHILKLEDLGEEDCVDVCDCVYSSSSQT